MTNVLDSRLRGNDTLESVMKKLPRMLPVCILNVHSRAVAITVGFLYNLSNQERILGAILWE